MCKSISPSIEISRLLRWQNLNRSQKVAVIALLLQIKNAVKFNLNGCLHLIYQKRLEPLTIETCIKFSGIIAPL